MDRGLPRATCSRRLPARVRTRSGLADLDREYSLAEIAIITRAGPARMLGLTHKGHLGPGADGDVTIYTPDADKRARCSSCRATSSRRARSSSTRATSARPPTGRTLHVAPEYDPDVVPDIEEWFDGHYSIQFANYPVGDSGRGQSDGHPVPDEGGRGRPR